MAGVRLLLGHPGAALIDCKDCCERLYNIETGAPDTYKVRDSEGNETEKPTEYDKAKLPPCLHGVTCPKGNIHTAKEKELTPANQQCWRAFKRWRLTRGTVERLGEVDELAADNFAMLERICQEYEKRDDAKRLAVELGGILVRAMSG